MADLEKKPPTLDYEAPKVVRRRSVESGVFLLGAALFVGLGTLMLLSGEVRDGLATFAFGIVLYGASRWWRCSARSGLPFQSGLADPGRWPGLPLLLHLRCVQVISRKEKRGFEVEAKAGGAVSTADS